ncbi:hypothetical protein QQZ08_004618 [Neonectria magnoliae]|uniref:Protein kinase domain-containing protein n=1 Tax=Neonectria magnoliae TaxID=2732573 RepID=A0ABR1I5K5_9HYPO
MSERSLRLCDQLDHASETCILGASNRTFVPRNCLQGLMDVPAIREELRIELGWWFLLRNRPLPQQLYATSSKVFAVLAMTRLMKCARDLHREGLTDSCLPLSRKNGQPDVLVSSTSDKTFTTFAHYAGSAQLFLEKQWQVLAPVFDGSGGHIDLDGNCPLPVLAAGSESTRGGASSVCRGTIHKSHFSGFKASQQKDLDIAIKELEATEELKASEVFDKERENLNDIKSLELHRHLIRAIATCQMHNKYYILFPWAEGGDLNHFWENGKGEGDASLVLWSLKQMEGLADALRLMHKINHRHGDLKPANILHFPKGNPFYRRQAEVQGTLVIADYGVSKRHQKATQARLEGTSTRATTRSYEAPEADGSQVDPRSRRYDMWSVGCIFLEFVVWLLYGHGAVKGFESQRIAKGQSNGGHASFYAREDDEELVKVKLNEAVEGAVTAILKDPKCSGSTAMGDFVRLITEHLLLIDPNQRDTAKQLQDKLREIVVRAESESSYLFRETSSQPDTPEAFRQNRKSAGRKLPTIDDMQA